jgi:hypothetical protein
MIVVNWKQQQIMQILCVFLQYREAKEQHLVKVTLKVEA